MKYIAILILISCSACDLKPLWTGNDPVAIPCGANLPPGRRDSLTKRVPLDYKVTAQLGSYLYKIPWSYATVTIEEINCVINKDNIGFEIKNKDINKSDTDTHEYTDGIDSDDKFGWAVVKFIDKGSQKRHQYIGDIIDNMISDYKNTKFIMHKNYLTEIIDEPVSSLSRRQFFYRDSEMQILLKCYLPRVQGKNCTMNVFYANLDIEAIIRYQSQSFENYKAVADGVLALILKWQVKS